MRFFDTNEISTSAHHNFSSRAFEDAFTSVPRCRRLQDGEAAAPQAVALADHLSEGARRNLQTQEQLQASGCTACACSDMFVSPNTLTNTSFCCVTMALRRRCSRMRWWAWQPA